MSASTPAAGTAPQSPGRETRRVSLGPTTLAPASAPAGGSPAEVAGFRLEGDVDLTAETAEFWVQSAAWSRCTLEAGGLDDAEVRRLSESVGWHEYFHRAWLRRGIEVRLLKFRLRA
jgi:tocopherol O-methyltransferase